MKIGYGKIGRSIPLPPDKWGAVAGDNEVPVLLNKLARRHPDVEWVIVGRNSGERPEDIGLPPNVTNPWVEWRPHAAQLSKSYVQAKSGALAINECQARYVQELTALTDPTFTSLDGIVLWAGQHGTSNVPIPEVGGTGWSGKLTQPQDSFIHYVSYITCGVNAWREVDPLTREEIWLLPDVRNYLKARDLKWPLRNSVMSQFTWTRDQRHERFGDPRSPQDCGFEGTWDKGVWLSPDRYTYDQLEIVGIPSSVECSYDWNDRRRFGLIINEARDYVKLGRRGIVRDWVLPLEPDFLHGKWTDKSLKLLSIDIQPLDWTLIWDRLRTVRSTFTTPSSGSGWATTKPWEAFAVGTVCFMHPGYDTQGNVIPTLAQALGHDDEAAHLARWLRVRDPAELEKRVKTLDQDHDAWLWLVQAQRRHFDRAMQEQCAIVEIERRLGL